MQTVFRLTITAIMAIPITSHSRQFKLPVIANIYSILPVISAFRGLITINNGSHVVTIYTTVNPIYFKSINITVYCPPTWS